MYYKKLKNKRKLRIFDHMLLKSQGLDISAEEFIPTTFVSLSESRYFITFSDILYSSQSIYNMTFIDMSSYPIDFHALEKEFIQNNPWIFN